MSMKTILARRAVLAVAAVTLVLGGAGAMAADAWRVFKRADLGYSIELPAEPKVSVKSVDTAAGAVQATTVALDMGDKVGAILVMSNAYPAAANPEAMLDGAVGGVVGDSRDITSIAKVTVDGSPGRYVTLKDKAGTYVAADLIVVRGQSLYQVLGIGPTAAGLPPSYERVRKSFRLLN